jgi:Rrf2 family protein
MQDIPPSFLSKIVHSLSRAGILSTTRGVGGGMSLGAPIEKITLLQVIETVEGPLTLSECCTDPPRCERNATCPAYPIILRAQQMFRRMLDVSIADALHGSAGAGATPDGSPERTPPQSG